MNDITQRARIEGQRDYVIKTRSWEAIAGFYQDLISKGWTMLPMLQLIEALACNTRFPFANRMGPCFTGWFRND